MNWVVFIIGMTVALCIRAFTKDQFLTLYPSAIIAFVTGTAFGLLSAKAKLDKMFPMEPVRPVQVKLRRMANRLRYLSVGGTLSKTGSTVRFDASDPNEASEFMDVLMAIVEAAE